ncbi:MAG: 50S ribosomal protein L18 [Elusimicrobia bacterium]|nr:50S ribosomal protein L18 [Elusimicrobiota bacterium]
MLSKKEQSLIRKKIRVRKKIFGTVDKPRMTINKSNKYIYTQLVDDIKGKTLLLVSTITLKLENAGNIKAATSLGAEVGKKAVSLGIKNVVFDRSGYIYHGKVKAFADAARAAGLKF